MRSPIVLRALALVFGCHLLGTAAACQRVDEELFEGIDDERVLPMLKHLPYEHGGMNVSPSDGRFLYDLILERNYKKGLEIGTSNGYSALWLGLALRHNGGSLITIEIDPKRGQEARENFRRAGLDKVIDCRIRNALEVILELGGDFDFVFIDAWKPDYKAYLDLVLPRTLPGGAITAHNVRGQRSEMRDFLEAIENDPALATTIHRTSWSGISVSRVQDPGKKEEGDEP